MKKLFMAAVMIIAAAVASAQAYEIPLWPDGPAESNGLTGPEINRDGSITNISEAWLSVWPAEGGNTGIGVVICPGGAYLAQAALHEGSRFAEWFAANGITAAVLKYRLPNGHPQIPLADARQAMKELRGMAPDLGIDPSRIGIVGFSAGGHLAATLLVHYDEGSRPGFGILYYPAISMSHIPMDDIAIASLVGAHPTAEDARYYSAELNVDADTPPALIFFSDDDARVDPQNGTAFYNALKQHNVPSAMYVFPSGNHGWGFGKGFKYHEQMKSLTLDWISQLK